MKNNVQSVEFEGLNVKDAIKKALVHFSVSREDLNISVVCEETKGLFGMEYANPAKIKVFLKKSCS